MQRQLGGGANEMRLSRERYILLLALTRAAADLIIVILFQSEGIVRAALLVLFWLMMPWLQIFEFWPKVRKTSTKSDKGSCTVLQCSRFVVFSARSNRKLDLFGSEPAWGD